VIQVVNGDIIKRGKFSVYGYIHVVLNANYNNISDIVVLSFIGGGKRSTRRKSPTCRKSLTNFYNVVSEYTLP
jgi:hypothetical protein